MTGVQTCALPISKPDIVSQSQRPVEYASIWQPLKDSNLGMSESKSDALDQLGEGATMTLQIFKEQFCIVTKPDCFVNGVVFSTHQTKNPDF